MYASLSDHDEIRSLERSGAWNRVWNTIAILVFAIAYIWSKPPWRHGKFLRTANTPQPLTAGCVFWVQLLTRFSEMEAFDLGGSSASAASITGSTEPSPLRDANLPAFPENS
jgi:hypothetical protein